MHSPNKQGASRLPEQALGGNPAITKTGGLCQYMLSSALELAVVLARVF